MNGPKLWSKMFDLVLPIYGSGLIAGGSPRDYVVNKRLNPRDVDIFVPVEDELELELGIYELNETALKVRMLDPRNGDYSKDELEASNVVGVLEGYLDGQKFNVIGKTPEKIADPQLLTRDFDHSLCHFWVTPDDPKLVCRSEAADLTLRTDRVTVFKDGVETLDLDRRTFNRLERMTNRRSKAYDRFTWKAKLKQPEFQAYDIDAVIKNYTEAPNRWIVRPLAHF